MPESLIVEGLDSAGSPSSLEGLDSAGSPSSLESRESSESSERSDSLRRLGYAEKGARGSLFPVAVAINAGLLLGRNPIDIEFCQDYRSKVVS